MRNVQQHPAGVYSPVMSRLTRAGILLGVFLALLSSPVSAQRAWNGGESSDWHAAANWTPSGAPAGESVVVDSVSPNATVLGGAPPVSINALDVALTAVGDLLINNGGELLTTANCTIANGVGSSGRAEITGSGSKWTGAPHSFTLGRDGYAELVISHGGVMTTGFMAAGSGIFSGEESHARGTLAQFADIRVVDADSRLETSANFVLNYGNVSVERGAVMDLGSVAFLGSTGRRTDTSVTGTGSLLSAPDGIIVGQGADPGSISTLTIGAGAGAQTTSAVRVATNGSIGELTVDGTLQAGATGLTVNIGGRLDGGGSISGSSDIAGTLAPGAPVGALSTESVVFQSTAELEFDLGISTSDSLSVDGDLSLDGTLMVNDAGGFGIGTYILMTYTGLLTDNLLEISALPGGFGGKIDTATPGEIRLVVSPDPIYSDRFQATL